MLPILRNVPQKSSINIKSFGGINTTATRGQGELTDCCNISLQTFPALSSRKRRKVYSQCDGVINGVGCYDGYFYTFFKKESNEIFLWYKNNVYNFSVYSNSGDFSLKRKFAKTENSIIIIPDNVVFYTDSLKFKSIDIDMYASATEVEQKVVEEFGKNNKFTPLSGSKDIGSLTHNQISTRHMQHVPGSHLAYDFYFFNFDENIEVGDVITVKMDAYSVNTELTPEHNELKKVLKEGVVAKVKEIVKSTHLILSGDYKTEVTALVFEDNSFVTNGYTDIVFKDISITKKLPSFTDITSFNNRIWGVAEKKIYASSLGDGDEWNDFSVDSYGTLPSSSFSASSGTDGNFTAIIPHGNFIYALKENYIHKIYGDTPDEYSVSNIAAWGALEGADTVCVCGANLMYASPEGICMLKDGYPRVVSRKIGQVSPVCADAVGGRFYVICQRDDGRILYVYDIEHDCWTAESCKENADNLCTDRSSICFSQGNSLICINCSEDALPYEKHVSWNFTMRFDNNEFNHKTATRAMARIHLGENAAFTSKLIYDDGSESAICGFCYDETQNGSSLLLLPVKRDLGFCIEFKGFGDFTLNSLKFNFYKGNEE